MKTKDNDMMRNLFAQLPDEKPPHSLNRTIMKRIRLEAGKKARVVRLKNILEYVSCAAIMIAACIFAFRYNGLSFELPDLQSGLRLFEKSCFEDLKSPSFLFCLCIGILVFLLLIADTLLRKHYGRTDER
jgi:hypothetical protein